MFRCNRTLQHAEYTIFTQWLLISLVTIVSIFLPKNQHVYSLWRKTCSMRSNNVPSCTEGIRSNTIYQRPIPYQPCIFWFMYLQLYVINMIISYWQLLYVLILIKFIFSNCDVIKWKFGYIQHTHAHICVSDTKQSKDTNVCTRMSMLIQHISIYHCRHIILKLRGLMYNGANKSLNSNRITLGRTLCNNGPNKRRKLFSYGFM